MFHKALQYGKVSELFENPKAIQPLNELEGFQRLAWKRVCCACAPCGCPARAGGAAGAAGAWPAAGSGPH